MAALAPREALLQVAKAAKAAKAAKVAKVAKEVPRRQAKGTLKIRIILCTKRTLAGMMTTMMATTAKVMVMIVMNRGRPRSPPSQKASLLAPRKRK